MSHASEYKSALTLRRGNAGGSGFSGYLRGKDRLTAQGDEKRLTQLLHKNAFRRVLRKQRKAEHPRETRAWPAPQGQGKRSPAARAPHMWANNARRCPFFLVYTLMQLLLGFRKAAHQQYAGSPIVCKAVSRMNGSRDNTGETHKRCRTRIAHEEKKFMI